jgi:hypothetical protein
MRGRAAERYAEAIMSGCRPRGFAAGPEDAEFIRTAITLAGARPIDPPRGPFVSRLLEDLAGRRRLPRRPVRPRWAAAAVAVALVGGTAAATQALDGQGRRAAVAHPGQVRNLTLLDSSRRPVGQIHLYRGDPSWVFMNLQLGTYDGLVECQLQSPDGRIVVDGTFRLTDGRGDWARAVPNETDRVDAARIVTLDGTTLASAGRR